jgi:hypothetical protein
MEVVETAVWVRNIRFAGHLHLEGFTDYFKNILLLRFQYLKSSLLFNDSVSGVGLFKIGPRWDAGFIEQSVKDWGGRCCGLFNGITPCLGCTDSGKPRRKSQAGSSRFWNWISILKHCCNVLGTA